MDKELNNLVLKYRECLEKLSRFNNGIAKDIVRTAPSLLTQQASPNRESPSNERKAAKDEAQSNKSPEAKATESKLDAIINQLKLKDDAVSNKEKTDAEAAKLAVRVYLDNVIWKLFSRTELQNNALLFNNDLNRISDKKWLMKLMKTLIDIDRETQLKLEEEKEEEEGVQADLVVKSNGTEEMDQFLADLHSWLVQVMTIYVRLSTVDEKKNVMELLLGTTCIANWAIPLIQFRIEKVSKADDYLSILQFVLCGAHCDPLSDSEKIYWTEDDYLAVIEQLAIDYNLRKVIDSISPDTNPQILFILCQKLSDILMKAMQRLISMKMVIKRLSQVLIQISVLLVDAVNEKGWLTCQSHIDLFITQIAKGLYDMEGGKGWPFLANIKYDVLSVNALWGITLHLLQIKSNFIPTSVSDVLVDNLPNTDRLQSVLHEYQTQGYFLLNCLANIALSIPSSSLTHINFLSDSNDVLSTCTIIVISYTLFTIAFVDKQLRELFYKDVRDTFSHISRQHTFITSLLFRWSVQHIDIMERMAIYLFRSIDLQNWHIVRDDLQLLHELLILPPSSSSTVPTTATSPRGGQQQQPAKILFARFVLEHLNYGLCEDTVDTTNASTSQPWCDRKIPFLDYDIHEEIAFLLLDTCQRYQPLPDSISIEKESTRNNGGNKIPVASTSSSSVLPSVDEIHFLSRRPTKSTSTESRSSIKKEVKPVSETNTISINTNELIDWAWTIAIQLKLLDCPISTRANDIESTIDIPFLRQILNHPQPATASHGALLIYISFMLSTTSRHFLRFETAHGWLKLLVLLKRSNKTEILIQILSELIPSFVYMHGDDFFNDESWNDILKQMVDFKSDPMLTQSAGRIIKLIQQQQQQQQHSRQRDKIDLKTPGNIMTGVGIIISSNIWHAHLIDSVSNLLDEDGKGFSYVDLVMHSWLKTVFRRHDWMWHQAYVSLMDTLCQAAWALRNMDRLVHHMLLEEYKRIDKAKEQYNANSPRLSRILKNMVIPEDAVATLLIGEWSVLRTTNTFNKTTPGIENRLFWFAFEALMVETAVEQDIRQELSEMIRKQLAKDNQQPQQKNRKLSVDVVSIYKQTASHAKKPVEYFAIYRWLQHILIMPFDHPLLPLYLQMFFSLYYQTIFKSDDHLLSGGSLFFGKKQDLIQKLQDYIANVQTYYGQKMTTAYNLNGNTDTLCPEKLQQLYYAMWLWLGNAELFSLKADLHTLPTLYDPIRLKEIYRRQEQQQPWVTHCFWLDVIDMPSLERTFLTFPWVGANKFILKSEKEGCHCQPSLRSKSSSTNIKGTVSSPSSISLSTSTSTTTRRGVRVLTDESTIMPLPPLIINEPTTKSTGSISRKLKR